MSSRLAAVVAAFVAVAFVVLVVQPAHAADQVSDGQWYHQFLNTAQAHQVTQGDGVTVAVIDSGVDATHPDLAGSVLPGTDVSSDGPGDGRTDTAGHGTKMASLIAGHGRVRGVAPAAMILPVRVGSIEGARGDWVTAGIKWAVAHGAKVISISIGGDDDPLKRQEVQAAIAADVVVVAGVGNRPEATSVRYPASYPGVVAVAAIDKNGEHAPISVTGQEVVIAAPGADISGAYHSGKYEIGTGTSNATAITAGAVALIRARFPQLKAAEVVRRLTATAIDKGSPGRDQEYGFGVLNLVGALTADLPTASSTPTKATGAPPGSTPSTPDGTMLPLWLLLLVGGAVAVVVVGGAVAVGAVVWSRSRRRLPGA